MGKWQKHRKHNTQESQEVSPFPAGDHKDVRNRHDSMTKTDTNTNKKWSTKEAPPLNGQLKKITGGLKPVKQCTNPILSSDVDQDT